MQKSLNLFRNFVELCKGLRLPTPVRQSLPREGRKVSCAECTEKNLLFYLPIHLFTSKKVAFTLAEVLITLGIIGVVAALTLPTLIQNHQKQAYVIGLKKGLNTIQNAFNQMKAEEGVTNLSDTELFTKGFCCKTSCMGSFVGDTDYMNYSDAENTLSKYLKVVKTYKPGEYITNHKPAHFDSTGKYILEKDFGSSGDIGNRSLILYTTDGMMFAFLSSGYERFIYIDVNGNKGPNQLGRDLFWIELVLDNSDGKERYFYDTFTSTIMNNGWKMDY